MPALFLVCHNLAESNKCGETFWLIGGFLVFGWVLLVTLVLFCLTNANFLHSKKSFISTPYQKHPKNWKVWEEYFSHCLTYWKVLLVPRLSGKSICNVMCCYSYYFIHMCTENHMWVMHQVPDKRRVTLPVRQEYFN